MNLVQTDTPANVKDRVPCRECGAPAIFCTITEWNDPRTMSYCGLKYRDFPDCDNKDIWIDVYQCEKCNEYTADLTQLIWLPDGDGFFLRRDTDKIEIAPGQLELPL